jgi:hypothetical protein
MVLARSGIFPAVVPPCCLPAFPAVAIPASHRGRGAKVTHPVLRKRAGLWVLACDNAGPGGGAPAAAWPAPKRPPNVRTGTLPTARRASRCPEEVAVTKIPMRCSQGPALITDWVGDPHPLRRRDQAHLVSLAGG